MTRAMLALALLVAPACLATTGDLADLRMRVERSEDNIVALVQDVRADVVAHEDALDQVEAEVAETSRVARQVERRPGDRGIGIVEGLIGLAVALTTGFTTYRVTNAARDRQRELLDEQVLAKKWVRRPKARST